MSTPGKCHAGVGRVGGDQGQSVLALIVPRTFHALQFNMQCNLSHPKGLGKSCTALQTIAHFLLAQAHASDGAEADSVPFPQYA